LGAEHLLADLEASTPTGVIDWADAAVADPADDVGLLLRDLGPNVMAAVMRRYRPRIDDPSLPVRALFHARCKTLEDLV